MSDSNARPWQSYACGACHNVVRMRGAAPERCPSCGAPMRPAPRVVATADQLFQAYAAGPGVRGALGPADWRHATTTEIKERAAAAYARWPSDPH